MDRHLDSLPDGLKTLVADKVAAAPATLGAAIGQLVDEAMADGWTYDQEHDSFLKVVDGVQKRCMVKVVWRAYVQERGA